MIVHEDIHDEFVAKLAKKFEGHKVGRFDEKAVTMGPITSQKQLDKVLGYIKIGKEEGATVVTGGKRLDREGYFVEPTLLTNVG